MREGKVRRTGALLLALLLSGCAEGVPFDSSILETNTDGGGAGSGNDDGAAAGTDGGSYRAPDSGDLASGDPFPGPEQCADLRVIPDRVVPTVAFLIDGSGSMTCAYPAEANCDCESQLRNKCQPEGTDTRWKSLGAALLDTERDQGADGVFKSLQEVVRFGMVIYNNHPDDARCPNLSVSVGAGLNRYDELAGAFPDEPPGFNTPTGPALEAMVRGMPDRAEAAAQGLGPQVIVLATDGQPFECTFDIVTAPDLDYDTVLEAARLAASKGIALYAISLAEATGEFADHLNEVASLGGTGTAYLPADRDDLIDDLGAIIGDAISCRATVRGTIVVGKECEGTVTLGGTELGCNQPDGFKLADEKTLELTGAACDTFKNDPGAELEAVFPCQVYNVE